MKILAIADEEDIYLNQLAKELLKDIDLIISCGDLKSLYLDYLVSITNLPLLYVKGNHDENYEFDPPGGGICIDDKVYKFKGLSIMGLGGCLPYKDGKYMYTEREMRSRARKLSIPAHIKGVDILVTHAPAKGYGDLEDYPHNGYETFNRIMDKYKPQYMLHGHVHTSYGRIQREHEHPSGTKIVNVCGYQIIKI
jgi:Icc-related predicted phosphoesterase